MKGPAPLPKSHAYASPRSGASTALTSAAAPVVPSTMGRVPSGSAKATSSRRSSSSPQTCPSAPGRTWTCTATSASPSVTVAVALGWAPTEPQSRAVVSSVMVVSAGAVGATANRTATGSTLAGEAEGASDWASTTEGTSSTDATANPNVRLMHHPLDPKVNHASRYLRRLRHTRRHAEPLGGTSIMVASAGAGYPAAVWSW